MPLSKSNPGRIFKVNDGHHVGPWPAGHKFSEYEFQRIHPAPKPNPNAPDDEVPSPDDYYKAAFDRLLKPAPHLPQTVRDGNGVEKPLPGAISEVNDEGAKPDPTPPGPESNPPKPIPNKQVQDLKQAIRETQQESAPPAPAPAPKK